MRPISKQQIGIAVRLARQRARLTQEQLAEQIGKTAEAVSNIERGLSLPSLSTLIAIGRTLEVPLSTLVGEASDKIRKAPKRLALEMKLQHLAESFDDGLLETAVKIVGALSELKR